MGVTLNKKIISEIQQLYGNYIETYNGIYVNDWVFGSIASLSWTSIAVNPDNGHMLAVNNNSSTVTNNYAYSNTGGISWVSFDNKALPPGNSNLLWKSVVYGNGRFVGITSSNTSPNVSKIFYSTNSNPTNADHLSYTITNVQNNNWESITYGNGYFVAVASSGTNRIIISNDGISWTSKPNTIADSSSCKFITYSQKLKRFVVLTSNTSPNKIIYSNYNGESWAETQIGTSGLNSVVWSPKLNLFVAVGNSATIYTSTEGILWELKTSPLSSSFNYTSVEWSQELEIFVAISNNTSDSKKIITSIDGNNWIIRNSGQTDSQFSTIVWNRFFGTFVSLANAGTNRVISTRALGDNTLLDKNNYLPSINELLYQFVYTIPKLYCIINTPIKNIYPVINEHTDFTFSLDSIDNLQQYLPTGLSLNSSSGEISGTPTVANDLITLKITATSSVENKTIYGYLDIKVANSAEQIINFKYDESNLIRDLNNNSIYLVPSFDSGTNISYTVNNPSLPSGLLLDQNSGIISGIVSSSLPSTSYTVTATNSIGSKTFNLNISVYVLKFKLTCNQVEIITSNQIINERNEELYDFSLGYISKNSYCNKNYGSSKGLLSRNFFFNKFNAFLPDMIKGLISYYRVRKSDNSVYESFLILEIKGDLATGNPLINWKKINFLGNVLRKSSSTVFYDSNTDSTIYKINYFFNPNFTQNGTTEIIIDNED